jgi:hypothetical protein
MRVTKTGLCQHHPVAATVPINDKSLRFVTVTKRAIADPAAHSKQDPPVGTDSPARPVSCRWCGRSLPPPARTGRPPTFCRRSCRQRDFEARERARRHGLDEDELVVTRDALETLRDHLYVVRCAVDDVRRDLAGAPTKADYANAVHWLMVSLEPMLHQSMIGPDDRRAVH